MTRAALALLLSCWLAAALSAAPPAAAAPSVDALLAQAEAVRSSRPREFKALLDQLDASVGKATPRQREQLAYLRAFAAALEGRHEVAIDSAVALSRRTSDVAMKYRAATLAVNSYAITRQFAEGLRLLEETLPLAADVEDAHVRIHGQMVAAQMYNQMGQFEIGLRYADQILAGEVPPRTACFAGQHRLEALQNLGRTPPEADVVALVGLCDGIGEQLVANLVRQSLARQYADEGRPRPGIDLLESHLDEVRALGYPAIIIDFHALLAELLLRDGQVEAAVAHAEAAIDQEPGAALSRSLVTAYKALYEIAEDRGDPVRSLEYYRMYAESREAYLADVKVRDLAYQVVRHEAEQQNQKIALLNQQNEVLRLQQQVATQAAQNTRLLIALLLLLLASIGYWAWRVTRRHHSLRLLAEVDSLTGVSNRRHFLLQAGQCLEQAARNGETVSLVMLDLDHFKQINDTYGHVTGDWVLERVAAECRAHCRRVDLFGRLGGEEFAILLPGCDVQAAARVAEQCRARIAGMDTKGAGHAIRLAASFGVTDSTWSGHVLSRLLSHADQALYRAKHGGRNLVCVYAGEPVRTRPPVTPPAGLASQTS